MMNKLINEITMKVSVKKESKHLLYPIYKAAKKNNIFVGCYYGNDKFIVSFTLDTLHWDMMYQIVKDINQFYPEADLTIEGMVY